MNPEEYLSHLIRNSKYGPLATSEHSELRKAIGICQRAILASLEKKEIGEVPDIPSPDGGPDPVLMMIRDNLVPFFPETSRDRISRAPVGTVYTNSIAGFATRVPGSTDAVVCIDVALKVFLDISNRCIKVFDPIEIQRAGLMSAINAYAATKSIHYLLSMMGKVLPPMPPAPRRDIEIVNAQTLESTYVQLEFILAHEYSHIALGHVDSKKASYNNVVTREELEADESAARAIVERTLARSNAESQCDIEMRLGAIAAIFYASDAMLSIYNWGEPYTRLYPAPEDRFDQVIETFRASFGDGLMGGGQFIRPFGLITHVLGVLAEDPLDAVGWFSEMASECARLGDQMEELFALSLAAEAARTANREDIREKILAHAQDCAGVLPEYYRDDLLDLRL